MDLATVFGLLIGIGGILLGDFFEGGHVASLLQFTAFVIVMMGTFGAVMVSNRSKDIRMGFKLFRKSFQEQKLNDAEPIAEIIECARVAKKETPLALDPRLPQLRSPLLADILRNVI